MTLQQLRDFISVVKHGGYRQAAKLSGLSQTGLTKSVSKLEADCGMVLLDRGSQGSTLSTQGTTLFRYAQSIVLEADRAQAWIAAARSPQAGTISFGVSIEPALHIVPAVLADFRRALPEVALHLSHGVASMLIAGLRENRLEFAITRLPDKFDASDLSVQTLFESEAVVVARPNHPVTAAASASALCTYDWVIVGDPTQPAECDPSIHDLFDERALARPRVAAVTDSLLGAVSMLVESDCLARLPRAALEHPLIADKLVRVDLEGTSRRYHIALVQRSGRLLSREAQTLAAMLASFSRIALTRRARETQRAT